MNYHSIGDWVFAIVVLVLIFVIISKVAGLLVSLGITNHTILSIVGIALLLGLARLASDFYDNVFRK